MSTDVELGRLLASWFDAEAPASAPPDLVADITRATASTRRRPGWLVPERWLPTLPAGTRAVLVAATTMLVLLAVIVGLLVLAGSRPRPPAPFGPWRPGALVYTSFGDLVVVTREGSRSNALMTGTSVDANPVFSPDGTLLAFWRRSPGPGDAADLMITDLHGSGARAIGHAEFPNANGGPRVSWSPDGTAIAYTADDGHGPTVYVAPLAGPRPVAITDPAIRGTDPAWSPDGGTIAFRIGDGAATPGLYSMRPDGSEVALVAAGELDGTEAVSWSPDSRRLAFTACNERCELHLVDVDGREDQVIDSAAADIGPSWSPDGSHFAWLRVPGDDGVGEYVVADADGANAVAYRHDGIPAAALDTLGRVVDWSPDGLAITGILTTDDGWFVDRLLTIDVATGNETVTSTPGLTSWDVQRLAP